MKRILPGEKQSFYFYLFLGAWTLMNLWSAAFTGLSHDEAYYWVYSQNLEWGYFDHPPAVALMIKAGYSLFHNELGVRLINVLGNSVGVYVLWKMCSRRYGRDLLLFILLLSGFLILHVYGFVIVPDSPLLISLALYFILLERYLNKDSIKNVFFLSLCIALMLYSKYHAILVLVFTLLACPFLLRKKSFWITALLSLLFFLPHIWWQYNNDFVTLRYHLLERANRPYLISFTTNYLLGVLLITGPFLSLLLWYVMVKVKVNSPWEQALRFNILGFLVFFFLSSFSHKIEANWVSPIVIPLVILSYKYFRGKPDLRKWAVVIGGASLGVMLVSRMYASNEALHNHSREKISLTRELFHWEVWSQQINRRADQRPVVFLNSYQHASKYSFYSGKLSHSHNTVGYRRNQFDLMDTEARIQGKDVLVISRDHHRGLFLFPTVLGAYYVGEIKNFRSYNQMRISLKEEKLVFKPGRKYDLKVTMKNRFPFAIDFRENRECPVNISISLFRDYELIDEQLFPVDLKQESLAPGKAFSQVLDFSTPEIKGKYHIFISFKSNAPGPGLNYSNRNLLIQ